MTTALDSLLGLCQIKLPDDSCIWMQRLLMRGRGCLDSRWTLQGMSSLQAMLTIAPCKTSMSTRQLSTYLKRHHRGCLSTAPRLGLGKLGRCGGQRRAAKVSAQNGAELAGS